MPQAHLGLAGCRRPAGAPGTARSAWRHKPLVQCDRCCGLTKLQCSIAVRTRRHWRSWSYLPPKLIDRLEIAGWEDACASQVTAGQAEQWAHHARKVWQRSFGGRPFKFLQVLTHRRSGQRIARGWRGRRPRGRTPAPRLPQTRETPRDSPVAPGTLPPAAANPGQWTAECRRVCQWPGGTRRDCVKGEPLGVRDDVSMATIQSIAHALILRWGWKWMHAWCTCSTAQRAHAQPMPQNDPRDERVNSIAAQESKKQQHSCCWTTEQGWSYQQKDVHGGLVSGRADVGNEFVADASHSEASDVSSMITNASAVRKLMAQRQCEVIAFGPSLLHNQSHTSFAQVIKVFATLIKVFARLIKVFAKLMKVVIRPKTRHYACMTYQCLQVVLSCHLSRSCALMSTSRLMNPSQSHLREQPRQSSPHQAPPSVQYKTIQGCIVSRPGWHIDKPRISLQSVSQGLISGFGGLSYHLDKLGKQLISGGRSSMVAENQAPRLRLAGRWNKDKSASDMDGYGKSLDLMGIHGASCLRAAPATRMRAPARMMHQATQPWTLTMILAPSLSQISCQVNSSNGHHDRYQEENRDGDDGWCRDHPGRRWWAGAAGMWLPHVLVSDQQQLTRHICMLCCMHTFCICTFITWIGQLRTLHMAELFLHAMQPSLPNSSPRCRSGGEHCHGQVSWYGNMFCSAAGLAAPKLFCSLQFLTAVHLLRRPTEVYSFKGPSRMNRRDQKKGQQTAVVGRTSDGDLEVTVHWDEPNPGAIYRNSTMPWRNTPRATCVWHCRTNSLYGDCSCHVICKKVSVMREFAGSFREVYRVPEEGVLTIESFTTINGHTESTLQVQMQWQGVHKTRQTCRQCLHEWSWRWSRCAVIGMVFCFMQVYRKHGN